MNEEVQKTILAVQDGTLAQGLKKNMRYIATGMAVGGFAGVLWSIVAGKPRMSSLIVGALIGGATGRLIAK